MFGAPGSDAELRVREAAPDVMEDRSKAILNFLHGSSLEKQVPTFLNPKGASFFSGSFPTF